MPDKPGSGSISEEWLLRGEHDLQSARLLYEQEGPTDTIAILLQQAAEKYLKGYLLTRGWKLQKTHDLEVLVSQAITYDSKFDRFLDFARIISAYYIEDRYPPGPPADYPREEIAGLMEQTDVLVTLIKETLRQ
jgi:HEPN domain-containing protein